MSNVRRILYVHPYLFFCFVPQVCTEPFIRFSNYLNSKKSELDGDFQEEYLDLRIENLPDYWPENIDKYRKKLKKILCEIYERFKFDIVAISCYSDFAYLNCIEVANMIKSFINPSSYIVVGGVHASIFPQGFNSENIPPLFNDYYSNNGTPIDYIILDEGEKPFFHFIQAILNNTIEKRKSLEEKPIILKREILDNLDEIPPLNLDLYKKYKNNINGLGNFWTRFNRGCAFRCKFCLPSENYSKSSKIVRFRSFENCIADLEAIINTKWLKIRVLHIVDPLFFPKRSIRNKFFKEMERLSDNMDFSLNIFDRVETSTMKDLDNYKKYNVTVGFGLESVSKKLLIKMGKVLGRDKEQIEISADSYLNKTINLIKYSNQINLPIVFFYMLGVPGTDKETLNERVSFFFDRRTDGDILMEKYKINLEFFMYAIFTGNTIYDRGEEMFGAKYHFPEWWKIFDKDQAAYAVTINPSKNLVYTQQFKPTMEFIKMVFKYQMKLKNQFYFLPKLIGYKSNFMKTMKIYEKNNNSLRRTNYNINIPNP